MYAIDAQPFIELPASVCREYLIHHRLCPIRFNEAGQLVVVTSHDPPDTVAVADVAIEFRASPLVEIASWESVERAIEHATRNHNNADVVDATLVDDVSRLADVRDLATQPPVVRYVNLLVREAHVQNASDIHLESRPDGMDVRYRVDGILRPAPDIPIRMEHAVVSRIKLLAELDIAERRRPQDGRIRAKLEEYEIDLRVSTVPTVHGESVVLRLLNRASRPASLEELGMDSFVQESFIAATSAPSGLVLVTGPTGSGKTTTLYTALSLRRSSKEKIITIEDPVEYQFPGIAQIPMDRAAGLTFPSVLRSVLRQDPDVILIGEMRDDETAQIAVQAAMTGHIVFSTLHTNDAVGAIARLADLGVPNYLIASTLRLVIAQRLVRKCCSRCHGTGEASTDVTDLAETARSPRACGQCLGTGFSGRIAIYESLRVDESVRLAITNNHTEAELRENVSATSYRTMRSDAKSKVDLGLTTHAEVQRVLDERE